MGEAGNRPKGQFILDAQPRHETLGGRCSLRSSYVTASGLVTSLAASGFGNGRESKWGTPTRCLPVTSS